MKKTLYILRLALVVMLPLLLVLAPAMSQTVVYRGKTSTLAVVEVPGHTYEWELYSNGAINFATVPGNCKAASANFTSGRYGPSVEVQWNALGTYFFKVTARDATGCAMNLKVGMIKVIPIEIYQIIANPDYARIAWEQDTTLNVLANDQSNVGFNTGSVRVIGQPKRGSASVNPNGSITYIPNLRWAGRDQFVYEVCNTVNLWASATVTIDIYGSEITTPEGFSPNGDGLNEYFYIKGLEKYQKSELYVYTRAGELIFQSVDYQNNWDGTTLSGRMTTRGLVPTGTYYYVLKLGGTDRIIKGFVFIGY